MRTLLILATLISMGCSQLQNTNIGKPDFKLESVNLGKSNFSSTDIVFNLAVENPNSFPLKISRFNYDIVLNGEKIASKEVEETIEAKAGTSTTIQLPVRVEHMGILKWARNLTASTKQDYQLSGSAQFGLFNIPFKKSGSLAFKEGELVHLSE